MIFWGVIAFILLLSGLILMITNGIIKDLEVRYDDACQVSLNEGQDCLFTFEVPSSISKPYLYYKLDNFFASHRQFVLSRSYS